MGDSCPVCSKPLSDVSPVVYKGEQLIHAGCWTEKPDTPAKAKPASPPPDKAPPRRSAT